MRPQVDLDRLYQLPLDEFTAARNALAKGAKNASEIRALPKPPVAAWAVNQLYWKDRRTWDALVDAAENLRRVNKAVLAGRSGDVRAAGAAHDAAVHDALKATLDQLTAAGHPATEATRQAVLNTLRALPADDPPGRLARVLQPGGFEMLAGLTVAGPARKETKGTKEDRDQTKEGTEEATKEATREATREATSEATKGVARSKADAKALTQAREAAATADRALKEAEQAVRRHEFEIARATRDGERAARAVEEARAALDEAKAALAAAERDQADARTRRGQAEAASKKATSAVSAARRQAAAAHSHLKKIQH
jgi:hypothetical protein